MVIAGMPVRAWLRRCSLPRRRAPFDSSRAAITPGILPGELEPLGALATQAVFLAAQVAGVAVAGAAVEVTVFRPALAIDAVTFGLSGLLIGFGTRARPAAAEPETASPWARTRYGGRHVFGEQARRTVVLFGWLAVLYIVPEGVAAPMPPDSAADLLRPAWCWRPSRLPTMIGTPLLTRSPPRARASLMGPRAAPTCATLVLTALRLDLAIRW